jgi:hypothetical protein
MRPDPLITTILVASLCLIGVALAQTRPLQPGANPVSNQGYQEFPVVVGAIHGPTRAIYNGNATACAITVQPNGNPAGVTAQHQSVQPGEFLPVQEISITATTCTVSALLEVF